MLPMHIEARNMMSSMQICRENNSMKFFSKELAMAINIASKPETMFLSMRPFRPRKSQIPVMYHKELNLPDNTKKLVLVTSVPFFH